MVVFDFNRDGLPDLFLVGAVVKDGKVRDLLLRNDGRGSFTDVTTEAGLDEPRPGIGCSVADFDNDGFPDLLLTGVGEQHLFRNNGKGGFEDVTRQAGLDQLKTLCIGAAFVDLDQDGDLDLVIAQYATPEEALALLQGNAKGRGAGLAVFENVGKAKPAVSPTGSPALEVAFRPLKEPTALVEPGSVVGLAVSDIDLDNDQDLLVLTDRAAPALLLNDRLLRFHRAALQEELAGTWNGALVLDTQHKRRSDLFLVGPGQAPLLLLNRTGNGQADVGKWFERGATNSPPLLQAQAIDLDRDGWTDVVGLSAAAPHLPVLLHNDGTRLVHVREGLGADAGWPKDVQAVAVANFHGDCLPHLMAWSQAGGLELHESQENGNHALIVDLAGTRKARTRCNNDGFGAWVTAQVDYLTTDMEYTTLSAGAGQSLQPVLLGIGQHAKADVVRFRWPDHTLQAEFDIPPCKLTRVVETDRRIISCPVLLAWDGKHFACITDFLGAGSMGEELPTGGTRYPRPEESLKIEPGQLVPKDGEYLIKIAEPMDEITYLDRLQLLVVDHPPDVAVFPDERFVVEGPPASQEVLAFREPIFPVKARDHRGRDVLPKLLRAGSQHGGRFRSPPVAWNVGRALGRAGLWRTVEAARQAARRPVPLWLDRLRLSGDDVRGRAGRRSRRTAGAGAAGRGQPVAQGARSRFPGRPAAHDDGGIDREAQGDRLRSACGRTWTSTGTRSSWPLCWRRSRPSASPRRTSSRPSCRPRLPGRNIARRPTTQAVRRRPGHPHPAVPDDGPAHAPGRRDSAAARRR